MLQLAAHQQIVVEGTVYSVAESIDTSGAPLYVQGARSTVYALVSGQQQQKLWALKVFSQQYQTLALVGQAAALATFAELPGLAACARKTLAPQRHPMLLRQHPELSYSVLMPWIEGPTWQRIVAERNAFSPEQSLAIAHALASTLQLMEGRGAAHCHLSSSHVILTALDGSGDEEGLSSSLPVIELVSVERMYASGLGRLWSNPEGAPGYSDGSNQAEWGPAGDRLSGAILIAEALGWCDEGVRVRAWGDSYFNPSERGQDTERFRMLALSLRDHWGDGVSRLFGRAWYSESLETCPPPGEWAQTISAARLPQSGVAISIGHVAGASIQPVVQSPPPPRRPAQSIHAAPPNQPHPQFLAAQPKTRIATAEVAPSQTRDMPAHAPLVAAASLVKQRRGMGPLGIVMGLAAAVGLLAILLLPSMLRGSKDVVPTATVPVWTATITAPIGITGTSIIQTTTMQPEVGVTVTAIPVERPSATPTETATETATSTSSPTSTPIPTRVPTRTPVPFAQFKPGDKAEVTVKNDTLWIRNDPAIPSNDTDNRKVAANTGELLTIEGGSSDPWWYVSWEFTGWCNGKFLRKVMSDGSLGSLGAVQFEDKVQVDAPDYILEIHKGAGVGTKKVGELPQGYTFVISHGPATAPDGGTWWHIDTTKVAGWTHGAYLTHP